MKSPPKRALVFEPKPLALTHSPYGTVHNICRIWKDYKPQKHAILAKQPPSKPVKEQEDG